MLLSVAAATHRSLLPLPLKQLQPLRLPNLQRQKLLLPPRPSASTGPPSPCSAGAGATRIIARTAASSAFHPVTRVRRRVLLAMASSSATTANEANREPNETDSGTEIKEAKKIKTELNPGINPEIKAEIKAEPGTVRYGDATYRPIREGKAVILAPEGDVQKVFYNPIQQFNRDLSVLAIKTFGEMHFRAKAGTTRQARERGKTKKRKREDGDGDADGEAGGKQTSSRKGGRTAAADGTCETSDKSADAAATEAHDPGRTVAEQGNASLDLNTGTNVSLPSETPASGVEANDVSGANGAGTNGAEMNVADTGAPGLQTTVANGHGPQPRPQPPPPRFAVLDALSATGLRALRYAHELPFVTSVTANDLTASAVDAIRLNASHNGLEHKITPTNEDAIAHMYRLIAHDLSRPDRHGSGPAASVKYHVIDLDPYGTAAPFFDAALQAVRDGGLLCVTCTDASVWAGHGYAEKSYALYGGVPLKGIHSHEAGLRIILHALASSAARYGLTVEPLLSLSIDFYCRVFVRVRKSPAAVKFLASRTMLVFSCDQGCGAWEVQYLLRNRLVPTRNGAASFHKHSLMPGPTASPECRYCGARTHVAGPMFGGHIHEPAFVRALLDQLPAADPAVYGTVPRIEGMLSTALEECSLPAVTAAESAFGSGSLPPPMPPIPPPHPGQDVDDALTGVDPAPFFFAPARLASVVSSSSPPIDALRGALRHLGYAALRSHCKPGSIKTDASWETVWWVMREWVRQREPTKATPLKEGSAGRRILGEDVVLGKGKNLNGKGGGGDDNGDVTMSEGGDEGGGRGEGEGEGEGEGKGEGKGEGGGSDGNGRGGATEGGAGNVVAETTEEGRRRTLVFDDELEKLGRTNDQKKLVRYQLNPRKHWGPMSKATGR